MTDLAVWREAPLGAVAEIRVSNVDKHQRPGEVPVRLCNYMDAYQNEYLQAGHIFMEATATHRELAEFGLRIGDVVVTKDSETPHDIGVASVLDATPSRLVCGYHLAIVRAGPAVNPVWLMKLFNSDRARRYFAQRAAGSTRYGLSRSSLARLPVPMPPRLDQDCAASILRCLDQAISETQQIIAKLDLIKQGLLNDLLTRGVDENGELRDAGRHPEQFRESEIGIVPCAWEVAALESVATVNRGKFTHRPRNDPRFYGGEFPFIQTGDVAAADGAVLSRATQTLNYRGAAVSQEFPAGTIAITIAANIADTAILGVPMYFPDSVVGGIPLPPNDGRFVEMSIRRAKARLQARAPQSAQKNINLQDLRPLKIALPEVAEQNRASAIYESALARVRQETTLLHKLHALKEGLMEDLLSGRVRVASLLQAGAG